MLCIILYKNITWSTGVLSRERVTASNSTHCDDQPLPKLVFRVVIGARLLFLSMDSINFHWWTVSVDNAHWLRSLLIQWHFFRQSSGEWSFPKGAAACFHAKLRRPWVRPVALLNRLYLFDQECLLSTFHFVSHWIQTDALANKDISLALQASTSHGYNFNKSSVAG